MQIIYKTKIYYDTKLSSGERRILQARSKKDMDSNNNGAMWPEEKDFILTRKPKIIFMDSFEIIYILYFYVINKEGQKPRISWKNISEILYEDKKYSKIRTLAYIAQ